MRAGPSSAVFAALMVLTAAWPAGPPGFAAVAPAAVAVLAGLFYRAAATAAVLLTVAALALVDVPPLFAAGSGVSAAAYLVTRHAVGHGGVAITVPAAAGLVGFTLVALIAVAVPLRLTWAPLLAPAVVLAILVVAGAPVLRDTARGPADPDRPA